MPDKEIYLKVLGTHAPLGDEDSNKFSLTNATYTIKNISFDGNFDQDPQNLEELVEAVSKAIGHDNIIAGGGTKKRRKRRKKNKKRKTINRK